MVSKLNDALLQSLGIVSVLMSNFQLVAFRFTQKLKPFSCGKIIIYS